MNVAVVGKDEIDEAVAHDVDQALAHDERQHAMGVDAGVEIVPQVPDLVLQRHVHFKEIRVAGEDSEGDVAVGIPGRHVPPRDSHHLPHVGLLDDRKRIVDAGPDLRIHHLAETREYRPLFLLHDVQAARKPHEHRESHERRHDAHPAFAHDSRRSRR